MKKELEDQIIKMHVAGKAPSEINAELRISFAKPFIVGLWADDDKRIGEAERALRGAAHNAPAQDLEPA